MALILQEQVASQVQAHTPKEKEVRGEREGKKRSKNKGKRAKQYSIAPSTQAHSFFHRFRRAIPPISICTHTHMYTKRG